MKKILIAVDHNIGAQTLARRGFELANSLDAETILLHVTSDATYYSSLNYSPILGFDSFSNLDVVQTDTIMELKRSANEYLESLKQSLGDNRINTIVKEGDFAENILQTAAEINADIIVVGTHSRKGLDKVLLGSVAEKVLRSSTIPLFIIPVKHTDEE
jgi:nucleotide-binding universal stress UspA family protein